MGTRAFSLLEVMVALAILAGALFVLVNSQTTAYIMTLEAQKMQTATMLAKEKMSQTLLMVESEGFQEGTIEEEGDFSEGIFGGFEAGGLDGQWEELNEEAFDEYFWVYTVREVELNLDGDMAGMADQLAGSGYWGEQEETTSAADQQEDQGMGLDDLGVSQDMLTDYLSPYIREVRVVVWWGQDDYEESGDYVELVTHIVNPTGQVVPAAPQL